MALPEQLKSDLEEGLAELAAKRMDIDNYWMYYHDEQPVRWHNDKMRDLFKDLDTSFNLNLCRMAINAPLNRLWVESWGEDRHKDLWQELRLDREQKRIYKHALVAGESYVIGWKADGQPLRAGFNDARNVALFFDAEDPKIKRHAVKLWVDNNDVGRAIVYYPEYTVRLVAPPIFSKAIRTRSSLQEKGLSFPNDSPTRFAADMFEIDTIDPGGPHSMGEVPVWRFSPDLWNPESKLADLTSPQDVINKLRANKMVASEAGAFPQRIYLTTQDLNPRDLVAEARTALRLDPGDRETPTRIEQFDATPLINYDQSIESEIEHFFTVAHLPKNLLRASGADASGDSFRSAEGPFQEMIRDIETNFAYSWIDMMHALTGGTEWSKPEWQDARINNSESQAREFKMLVEAGMPTAFAAIKAFQWSLEEAKEAGLKETVEQPVTNLSDRNPAAPRTQTTEDEPQ